MGYGWCTRYGRLSLAGSFLLVAVAALACSLAVPTIGTPCVVDEECTGPGEPL